MFQSCRQPWNCPDLKSQSLSDLSSEFQAFPPAAAAARGLLPSDQVEIPHSRPLPIFHLAADSQSGTLHQFLGFGAVTQQQGGKEVGQLLSRTALGAI